MDSVCVGSACRLLTFSKWVIVNLDNGIYLLLSASFSLGLERKFPSMIYLTGDLWLVLDFIRRGNPLAKLMVEDKF